MRRSLALVLATSALAVALPLAAGSPAYAGSVCKDGSYTKSEGRGTCSGHGGVSKTGVNGPSGSAASTPSSAAKPVPAPAPAVPATPGTPVDAKTGQQVNALTLLNSLAVAPEYQGAYSRDNYKHWISTNGCDTRQWVFIRQTLKGSRSGCTVTGGEWYSAYDGKTTSDPRSFDVDHMVPLAQANASGAYAWSADQRMYYANDLDYKPALIAVSAASNRSKSDKDPARWMPPLKSDWCDYLKNWIGVKYRWDLTVDPAEKNAIVSNFKGCPTDMATPPKAPVAN